MSLAFSCQNIVFMYGPRVCALGAPPGVHAVTHRADALNLFVVAIGRTVVDGTTHSCPSVIVLAARAI